MIAHRNIFKRDSAGKTRVWRQEQDGARYRTVAGILGGALVESGWTVCTGKQGRSDEEQAAFEIEAAYKHKLTREYHETVEATGGGAHFFKPMLAQKYEDFTPGYAQPKLDGVRCIVTVDGMFSREGKPIFGAPHIRSQLQPLFEIAPELVFDGEIYNHLLKDDFNSIVSIVKKQTPTPEQLAASEQLAQYHIYDLASMPNSFGIRNKALRNWFRWLENNASLVLVETHNVDHAEEYDALHGTWLEDGFEGSMWRADAPYEQKRSKHLLKRKEMQDAEFECIAIEEGVGNWSGLAKRVTCRLPDGRTFGAGIKGNQERAKELLNESHNIVTVQFFQLTPDGIPRFPVVTKFHGKERTL